MNGVTPFEIHLTTENIPKAKMDKFVSLCSRFNGKALLIKLTQGDFTQQPMFTKTVIEFGLSDVLLTAQKLSQKFHAFDFSIQRIKIETDDIYSDYFEKSSESYFEWHGKINLDELENVSNFCQKHKVHLSKNSLKDEPDLRFITLREFEAKEIYHRRLSELLKDLENVQILKQQSEFCLYDSNTNLDKGWLPE